MIMMMRKRKKKGYRRRRGKYGRGRRDISHLLPYTPQARTLTALQERASTFYGTGSRQV